MQYHMYSNVLYTLFINDIHLSRKIVRGKGTPFLSLVGLFTRKNILHLENCVLYNSLFVKGEVKCIPLINIEYHLFPGVEFHVVPLTVVRCW